ncbi:MAG: 3-hydroxyacyl-CoA dehydrogenase NAD-binding domain-containing protein, partial [Bacteroidota bacterium]
MIKDFEKIAVIGAGTMGNGIAHVFAQHGYQVNLVDVNQAALEKGLSTIGVNLDRQIKKEIISSSDKAAILQRIESHTDLAAGVVDRQL